MGIPEVPVVPGGGASAGTRTGERAVVAQEE